MSKNKSKKSVYSRIRNYFIAGIFVLIPIGITIYLTIFLINISSKLIPQAINPDKYLNAIISLNPDVLDNAKQLDKKRKKQINHPLLKHTYKLVRE